MDPVYLQGKSKAENVLVFCFLKFASHSILEVMSLYNPYHILILKVFVILESMREWSVAM